MIFRNNRTKDFEIAPYVDAQNCETIDFYDNGRVKRIVYKKNEVDNVQNVIEVSVGKKYIIMANGSMPHSEAKRLDKRLNEWIANDEEAFILLNGDMLRLEKV